jgi:flagellar biosynthesis/type III secretory pathway chaperone
MTSRSARETLESLRITLQKLEQTCDTSSDRQGLAELKQILLNRIAELETLRALNPVEAEIVQEQAPSDLPSIASIEAEPAIETAEAVAVEKLD